MFIACIYPTCSCNKWFMISLTCVRLLNVGVCISNLKIKHVLTLIMGTNIYMYAKSNKQTTYPHPSPDKFSMMQIIQLPIL